MDASKIATFSRVTILINAVKLVSNDFHDPGHRRRPNYSICSFASLWPSPLDARLCGVVELRDTPLGST